MGKVLLSLVALVSISACNKQQEKVEVVELAVEETPAEN